MSNAVRITIANNGNRDGDGDINMNEYKKLVMTEEGSGNDGKGGEQELVNEDYEHSVLNKYWKPFVIMQWTIFILFQLGIWFNRKPSTTLSVH